jgi:hypothetical protein
MALTDDLRDYIANNSSPQTKIAEKHDVAIVGETHGSGILASASVRLLLELLGDPKYRYFACEHYHNKGLIRKAVRTYMHDATLPPAFDPQKDADLDVVVIGERILVRRFQEVLDYLRVHPRYILSIGTLDDGDATRDARLAQHFFEEIADRKLHVGIPGVLLVGWNHARAVSDQAWPTVRNLLEKRGFRCVSIRVLTNFTRSATTEPEDTVVPRGTDLNNLQQSDLIRLSSLVTKTPVTIATDRPWKGNQPSPFQRVTFGHSNTSVAQQCEYIVLQTA